MRRTLSILLVIMGLTPVAGFAADKLQQGEYVCSETPSILPCSPVHLFIGPGNHWKWGKREGTWQQRGRNIDFDGPKRGPVVWGKAHVEGDSIRWVDGKNSMAFTRSGGIKR